MQGSLDSDIQYHIQAHNAHRQNADHIDHLIQQAHSQGVHDTNYFHQLFAAHTHHKNQADGHLQQIHALDWQIQQQYQVQHHHQTHATEPNHQMVLMNNPTQQSHQQNGMHADPSAIIEQLHQHIQELNIKIYKLNDEIAQLKQTIHDQYQSLQHLNSLIKDKIGSVAISETVSINDAIEKSNKILKQMENDVIAMRQEKSELINEIQLLDLAIKGRPTRPKRMYV